MSAMNKPVRVLIVDDSSVFRTLLKEIMKSASDVEVVGSVRNGREAMEWIERDPPDLLTLDVEMPEMDGLTTLRAVEAFNNTRPMRPRVGAIMLSSLTRHGADTTIEALECGAFDFLTKPAGLDARSMMQGLQEQLLSEIRAFASQMDRPLLALPKKPTGATPPSGTPAVARDVRPTPLVKGAPFVPSMRLPGMRKHNRAIVIGVSTGGPRALGELLPPLCEVTSCPILVVQHMPATFTASLAASLDTKCKHRVLEAQDKMVVEDGYVYIAPGSHHLVPRPALGEVVLSVKDAPPELGCRPSVNILFRGAAKAFGANQIALILTGMGSDGEKGLHDIRNAGGYVIAQDEASSVVWGMPGSAVQAGVVDEILPLGEIPGVVDILTTGS